MDFLVADINNFLAMHSEFLFDSLTLMMWVGTIFSRIYAIHLFKCCTNAFTASPCVHQNKTHNRIAIWFMDSIETHLGDVRAATSWFIVIFASTQFPWVFVVCGARFGCRTSGRRQFDGFKWHRFVVIIRDIGGRRTAHIHLWFKRIYVYLRSQWLHSGQIYLHHCWSSRRSLWKRIENSIKSTTNN